jgi:hypothetical protein
VSVQIERFLGIINQPVKIPVSPTPTGHLHAVLCSFGFFAFFNSRYILNIPSKWVGDSRGI